MVKHKRSIKAGAAVVAALLGAGVTAPVASALPPNCTQQFWMIGLRKGQRTICDGPQAADGSWLRGRSFNAPAFIADGYSVCYGYGFCTFTAPKQVAAIDQLETYRVTPDTVLPDEPGYIGIVPAAGIA